MPVEFLSDEQAARFGRFVSELPRDELERFFYMDPATRGRIDRHRRDHNRLGFALQVGTVRFLGTFLSNPLDAPWPAVEYLARQLGIADPSVVKRYAERIPTQHEHAREIRDALGFRGFNDPEANAEFDRFLRARAWTNSEGPTALFDQAASWLRRQRVLLPGVTVLARLVASVRDDAEGHLHEQIADRAATADPALPGRLLRLLEVSAEQRFSELERLRRAPTRTSGREMGRSLERVVELAMLGAASVDLSALPANRISALARYGLSVKAPTLRALAEPRRTATLLVTCDSWRLPRSMTRWICSMC